MMTTALAQLRAKTDRELAELIRKEAQRLNSLTARGRYIEAVQLSRQLRGLLIVSNLSEKEREKIERSLVLPATACA
jgi:hypothetical protein